MPQDIGKLTTIRDAVEAMRASGQSDETIVERLVKNENLDQSFKNIFSTAKNAGMQKKAVDDFLALPTRQIVSPSQLETKGKLGTAARFLGVEPLGRFTAAQLAKLSPEHRANIRALKEQGQEEAAKTISTGGVSGRQLLGSALQTAGMIALPFAGRALSAGTFGQRVAASSLTQAGFGGAAAMAEGKSGEDIKNQAIFGAIVGAAFPVAGAIFRGIGNAIRQYPETAYGKIFRATEKDISQLLETKGTGREINPSLAKEISDLGVKGTAEEMGAALSGMRRNAGRQLDNIALGVKDKVKLTDRKHLLDILKSIRDGFDESLIPEKVKEANRYINYLSKVKPKDLSAKQALDLKQFIDSTRVRSSFNLNPSLSVKQDAYKKAADALRAGLRKTSPAMAKGLDTYRIATQGFSSMVSEAVRERNMALLNRLDALAIGAGFMVGEPTVGMTATGLMKLTRSPRVLTSSAQAVRRGTELFAKSRALGSVAENIRQAGSILSRRTLSGL